MPYIPLFVITVSKASSKDRARFGFIYQITLVPNLGSMAPLRVASLFSGCGGLDLGLEQVSGPARRVDHGSIS